MPTANLLAAVILAGLPTLGYLFILNLLDRYEKEPWRLMLACVGAGAILAPLVSIGVLRLVGHDASLAPQLAPGAAGADPLVAIVEELVKGLLLIAVVRLIRDEFDDVIDGVVYGAAVGAGFAASETFLYVLGGVGGLGQGTLFLLLLAGLGHACYGAVTGAALGFASRLADRRQAVVVIAYGLASAALFHALHDALSFILARLVERPDAGVGFLTLLLGSGLNFIGLVALGVLIIFAWRNESQVLREQLAPEVEGGLVSARDYQDLSSTRARIGRQLGFLRARNPRRARAQRQMYAALGELAFHKRRAANAKRHAPDSARDTRLRLRIQDLGKQLGEGG